MALSKRRKRWLIAAGIILTIIIILLLFLNNILSNKAESILRKEIAKIDSTAYHIDFEKVRIDVFTLSASIYGISVKPTAAALEEVKRSQLSKPVFEVSVDKIKLGSVAVFKAMKGKEFNAGSFDIEDPIITVYSHHELFPAKSKTDEEKKGLFSSDSDINLPFKEASLGWFVVRNANVTFINVNDKDPQLLAQGLTITLNDISVEQPDGDTSKHVLSIDEYELSFASLKMPLPGGLYSIDVGAFDAKYSDQSISIDSLQLIPAYNKVEFAQIIGTQTDRFDLEIDNISINGIDFDSLVKKKVIFDNIVITRPTAEIYRDKRIPMDLNHLPKLFQTAIAEAPIYLDITKVMVLQSNITYSEQIAGAARPGHIMFDKLDIEISGITNDKEVIKDGTHAMFLDGKGLLMGKSDVELHCELPIGSKSEAFTFYGTAASFNPQTMTPMLEPLAFIAIKEGTVKSVNFYCFAKKDTSVGRMEFLFNDLNAAVLKKDKEAQGVIKDNKFLSFLVGAGMVKNNPNKDKPVRLVQMSFVRDRNKGFFNFVWKTIQKGLTNTVIPGKKHVFYDMTWPEFTSNWGPVLHSDWIKLTTGVTPPDGETHKEEREHKKEVKEEDRPEHEKTGKEKRQEKREERKEKKDGRKSEL